MRREQSNAQRGAPLEIEKILAQLKTERDKLDAAIRVLQELAAHPEQRPGSPRKGRIRRGGKTSRDAGAPAGVPSRGKLIRFAAHKRLLPKSRAAVGTGSGKGTWV